MIPTERLRDVRTMQDLRAEKARLRYEALMAEKDLTDSLRAVDKVFTFFTLFRRAAGGVRYAYGVLSRVSGFFGGLFGKRPDKEDAGNGPDSEVVSY